MLIAVLLMGSAGCGGCAVVTYTLGALVHSPRAMLAGVALAAVSCVMSGMALGRML